MALAPSLLTFVGDLETEDVARRAEALREMLDSPAWGFYQEMLEVQATKLRRQQEVAPLADVQTYAHGNGVLYGMRQAGEIVGKFLAFADRELEKPAAASDTDTDRGGSE